MGRFGTKLTMLLFLIGFGIFIGVDVAHKGMEEMNYFPSEPVQYSYQEDFIHQRGVSDLTNEPESNKNLSIMEKPSYPVYVFDEQIPKDEGMLAHTADLTARLLQKTSQKGVEVVVSIFEKLFN